MAKRTPKDYHDPATPSRNTGHPLLQGSNQALDIMEKIQQRQQFKEFQIEEIAKWRETINRIMATQDGRTLLKAMIGFSGLLGPQDTRDTLRIVEQRWKLAFYLTWIRPYLDPTIIKDIEL